jgi:sigma-B regulation protein RsbU (phosphoserine phosphatase)
MSAVTVALGLLAELGGDLDVLAGHLHRQLYRSLSGDQFVTLFLGELDARNGTLRYVNAGHEPPILLRAGGEVVKLPSTGTPIAMLEELITESAEITLESGDLLAVFSDGIPEATTAGEDFYGIERLQEILVAGRRDDLAALRRRILASIEAYLHGETNSDDVTLVLLRRN